MDKKAICLVSGGMDSCVTAAYAIKNGYDVSFLHINYGQRTQKKEMEAFENLTEFYGIKNKMSVDISYLKNIGGSSLTDFSLDVEEGSVPKSLDKLPSTYVPFRNANMIAIAVSWAETIDASKIFIGAVEEDSSGYPDCSAIFFEKFNELLKVAITADKKIRIETPIINLSKAGIVKLGLELKAPLNLTWSCYQREDKACGVCESCFLRLRGFKEAGVTDPIEYK